MSFGIPEHLRACSDRRFDFELLSGTKSLDLLRAQRRQKQTNAPLVNFQRFQEFHVTLLNGRLPQI